MSEADPVFSALARTTRDVHGRPAAKFDAGRPRHLQERAGLERCVALVPEACAVLVLGCGAEQTAALQAGEVPQHSLMMRSTTRMLRRKSSMPTVGMPHGRRGCGCRSRCAAG